MENVHYRLAAYYLNKLRAAEDTYQHGHEHSSDALTLFDHEWPHIKQWQNWAATHASSDDRIAFLCKEYSRSGIELLALRQHPQEHLAWLEAGLLACRQLGDSQSEMIHLHLIGRAYHAAGSLELAQNYNNEALSLARQQNNPFYESTILIALGTIFYSDSEYRSAQEALEQALVLSKELGAKLETALALTGLGNVAFARGDYTNAYDCLVQALQIYEMSGLPHHVCKALDDLSNLTLQMGDEDATLQYAKRCAALSRSIGDQRHLALSLGVLGNLAKTHGNLTEAREYFRESLDMSRLLGRPSAEVLALIRLGTLYLQLGDLTDAFNCFESALALPNAAGYRSYSAIALMCMAQILRQTDNLQDACSKLHDGLEIAVTIPSTMIRTFYLLEAAWLWYAFGQFEQAAAWTAILEANIHELDGEQLASLAEMKQKLREELGATPYTTAAKQGKNLDLDSVLQKISSELQIRFGIRDRL